MEVNPASAKGKRQGLPWEMSAAVRANRTTRLGTVGEGCRQVSRRHSRWRKPLKGRIIYGKEQAGILDGREAPARHVDPIEAI